MDQISRLYALLPFDEKRGAKIRLSRHVTKFSIGKAFLVVDQISRFYALLPFYEKRVPGKLAIGFLDSSNLIASFPGTRFS